MKGLLGMRDKFERIVTEALCAEKAAQKKLQEAFEVDALVWVRVCVVPRHGMSVGRSLGCC